MKLIPWITLIASGAALVSPPGQAIFHNAFLSNEQLSRNIAQPIFVMALGAMVLMVAIELLVRLALRKRRLRQP